MQKTGKLISAMIDYYAGDVRRINHFLKVYSFAKAIGEQEELESSKQEILEVAALVHDIGIKVSEEKYQSSDGKYQELEGPAVAEELLTKLGYDNSLISRVCFLIGHHHTYDQIDDLDYQILVEADFLVNIYEDGLSKEAVEHIKKKIFKTHTGHQFLNQLFMA